MKRCLLLILLMLMLPLCAHAEGLEIKVNRDNAAQGFTENVITVKSDAAGSLSMSIGDEYGVYRTWELAVEAGETSIPWDGFDWNQEPITDGKHYACLCGGTGDTFLPAVGHTCNIRNDWQDLNAYLAGQQIADGTIFDLAAGRYYLTADLTVNYYLNIPAGVVVSIDLNGHTLTGAAQPTDNTPLVRMKSTGELNVCDSSFDATAETADN